MLVLMNGWNNIKGYNEQDKNKANPIIKGHTMKEETTPIQVPLKLHLQLSRDLLKSDKFKTYAQLIKHYRKLALQFIKQTK